jgi:hypothetical protein
VERSLRAGVADDPVIVTARVALDDVNNAIRAYQEEKLRLEGLAEQGSGVKALAAQNQVSQYIVLVYDQWVTF